MGKNTRRANGEGSITRRPNGAWQAQASVKVDGKYRRLTVTGRTKTEARAKLTDLQKQLTGTRPTNLHATVTDVLDNFDRFLDAQVAAGRIKVSTREWKRDMLLRVPDTMREMKARDLTATDIEEWVADISGSASGRRGSFNTLRQAYKVAVRDRLVHHTPFEAVDAPSGTREKEPKHATKADVETLVADADAPWNAYWRVLADTGMRKGELLALRWDDVDLDARVLLVRQGKTDNARRAIPLTDAAVEALRSLPRRDARVCPYSTRYLSTRFARSAPEGLTPHGLRHGLATRLLESGVPVHTVSAILGHASPSITLDFYAHAVPAEMRAAMGKL